MARCICNIIAVPLCSFSIFIHNSIDLVILVYFFSFFILYINSSNFRQSRTVCFPYTIQEYQQKRRQECKKLKIVVFVYAFGQLLALAFPILLFTKEWNEDDAFMVRWIVWQISNANKGHTSQIETISIGKYAFYDTNNVQVCTVYDVRAPVNVCEAIEYVERIKTIYSFHSSAVRIIFLFCVHLFHITFCCGTVQKVNL